MTHENTGLYIRQSRQYFRNAWHYERFQQDRLKKAWV